MAENDNKPTRETKKNPSFDNIYGHVTPQATEIEKRVLGALMIDKDAFTVVSELLHPETFYDRRHQKIYHAIQSLNIEEKAVDILTVVEQLKKEKTLEDVGGAIYIAELSQHVYSSANIEFHAHILAQKYLARELISFAGKIETKAFDEATDTDDLMQEAENMLFELSQKNLQQAYTQIDPVVAQAMRIIEKASENTGGLTGVPSGFTALDNITSGWQPSDLVIIAGRPAMGKTSFALSIAKNIVVDYDVPMAFFSLEMNNVQLINRLISNTCEIEGSKIMNGQLNDDEWKRLDKNIRKLYGKPLYVDDTPALSVFELRTKARRLVKEKKVQLIKICYLQLMHASVTRFCNRQEEVFTISRSLKGLSNELNIPVLALSQLNRTVENREGIDGKRPQLSDLRESGAIEQDADMVLFVHRPEYYHIYQDKDGNSLKGMAEIIIAKHRKGAIGDVRLSFKGQYTRFANPEDSYVSPQQGGEFIGSRMNGNDIGAGMTGPIDDPLGPPPPDTTISPF